MQIIGLATAVGLGLVLAGAVTAEAQSVGSYAGTQANGQSINFTVSTDSTTGAPEITAVGFGILANCTNGSTVTSGLGTGAATDVVKDKATVKFSEYNAYYVLSVTFGANDTATGSLTVDVPALVASSGAPKKAVFCGSGKQTFSATLGGAAAAATFAAPPRTLVY